MKNIKRRMEGNYDTKIELENWQQPEGDEFSNGSMMLSATVKDGYTGKVLLKLAWYYDFDKLMADLNEKMATILYIGDRE